MSPHRGAASGEEGEEEIVPFNLSGRRPLPFPPHSVIDSTVRRDYFVGLEILGQSLYRLLGIGLVGVGEAAVLGSDEMPDEGECVLQLIYDGIFIVLMGQVVAGGDVGTAHADAIERQGEDIATLAGSN